MQAYKAMGYQQIVSPSTAQALTVPTDTNNQKPNLAIITCTTQAIRIRDDGTNPTTTVGVFLPVNVPYYYRGPLSALRLIQVTTNATVDILYYQDPN